MRFLFNGQPYAGPAVDAELAEVKNPVTEEVMAELAVASSAAEAERILDLAESGFRAWSAVPLWRRADVIYRFADLLEADLAGLADVMARNMGRAITECLAEASLTAELARGFAERAKHLYNDVMSDSQRGLEGDLVFTRREPLGVFLCIVPFNASVELYVHKVVPALLMGNAALVKPPTDNPLADLWLTDMMVRAGVPEEAIQVVYAPGEFVSSHLTSSSRIAAVTFTGSTSTGRSVMEAAAPALHRVFLEMGGNDALIVTEDADLDYAADELVATRILNSGQVCCASKRTLVADSIAEEFVAKVRDRLEKVVQGDPLDPATEVGSLVTAKAAQAVGAQVDKTIAQGATCLLGGRVRDRVFYEPTLLVDVTKEMDVANDMEIFGPVIAILRYGSLDEAIEIANQTSYGLQASIISGDVTKAIDVASRLQAGMVVVNGAGSYRHMDMPFGGTKSSGIGREGIAATLEEFSQEKCYVMKRVFSR